MTNWRAVVAISFVSILSGCGGSATLDDGTSLAETVPIERVLNSLKCGLARAIINDHGGYAGLYGAKAKVVLKVNLIQDHNASGNISVGIPVFHGVTVTPTIGASSDDSRTYNTTVAFNIDLSTRNDAICRRTGAPDMDAGFSAWFSAEVNQINDAIAGPPRSSIQSYIYETDFVLIKKDNAGLDVSVAIIPIKAGAAFAASRQDIQHMTITIGAVHIVDGKPVVGAPPHDAALGR